MIRDDPYRAWLADDDIKAIRDRLKREYDAVYATALGPERISGERGDEPAIHVYVDQKITEADLPDDQVIPRRVDGIRIDVREVDRAAKRPATDPHPDARLDGSPTRGSRVRPLMGGIGPSRDTLDPDNDDNPMVGTLGIMVEGPGGEDAALTNEHVLVEGNTATQSGVDDATPYTQPHRDESQPDNNEIAQDALDWGDWPDDDWGLMEIDSGVAVSNEIIGLGAPDTIGTPSFDDRVIMSSRRNGLVGGELITIDVDAGHREDYEAVFDESPVGEDYDGASGSVLGIIDDDEYRPFGLIAVLGDTGDLWANDLSHIQSESGFSFLGSGDALPDESDLYGDAYIEAAVIAATDDRTVDVRVVNAGGSDTTDETVSIEFDAETVDQTTVDLDAFAWTTVTLDWPWKSDIATLQTADESWETDISAQTSAWYESGTVGVDLTWDLSPTDPEDVTEQHIYGSLVENPAFPDDYDRIDTVDDDADDYHHPTAPSGFTITYAVTATNEHGESDPTTDSVETPIKATGRGQTVAGQGTGGSGTPAATATAIGAIAATQGTVATVTPTVAPTATGQGVAAFGTGAVGTPGTTAVHASGQHAAAFGTGATIAPSTAVAAAGQTASTLGTGATGTLTVVTQATATGQVVAPRPTGSTGTATVTIVASGQRAGALGTGGIGTPTTTGVAAGQTVATIPTGASGTPTVVVVAGGQAASTRPTGGVGVPGTALITGTGQTASAHPTGAVATPIATIVATGQLAATFGTGGVGTPEDVVRALATGQTVASQGTGGVITPSAAGTGEGQTTTARGTGGVGVPGTAATTATGQQAAALGTGATVTPTVTVVASGQQTATLGTGGLGSPTVAVTATGQLVATFGTGGRRTVAVVGTATGQTAGVRGTGAGLAPTVSADATGGAVAVFGTDALGTPGTAAVHADGQVASARGSGATATPGTAVGVATGQHAAAFGTGAILIVSVERIRVTVRPLTADLSRTRELAAGLERTRALEADLSQTRRLETDQ